MTTTSTPKVGTRTIPPRAILGLLAPAALTMIGAQLANPGFDPSWRPISDYALGNQGWLMTICFLAWGAAVTLAAVRLWPMATSRLARTGIVLLTIGGLGPIIAGIFPGELSTAPTAGPGLHALGAVLPDLGAIGAVLLWIAMARKPDLLGSPRELGIATVLVWLTIIGLTVALASFAPDGVLGPDAPIGWPNRAVVVGQWVLALALARLPRR